MKSDREFLDDMWETVLQTEYEEQQKIAARIRHHHIMKKNIIGYLLAIIAFTIILAAIWISKLHAFDSIYIVSAISLILAYWLDQLISESRGNSSYEN